MKPSNLPPFPKIEITFGPAWWCHYYGMDFGTKEAWHDPIKVTEREREQRRILFERFGDVGLGEIDPEPDPIVGGEFGHRFMSAFWGCDVDYVSDQWPHATPLPIPAEKIAGLRLPDVDSSLPVKLVRQNARILTNHYGLCRSAINYGGPLNNAVSVFGETAFEICAADHRLAQDMLRKMGHAVMLVHDLVEAPINGVLPARIREGDWAIGNCPVGQISPSMYHDIVLPVDLEFRRSKQGSGFSLHHCGVFHPYVNVYQSLNPTDIDVGPGTDLRLTRLAYPDANISAYFDPAEFTSLTQQKVDDIVYAVIQAAAPVEKITFIRAIEVGPELSDESVRALMTVRERIQI